MLRIVDLVGRDLRWSQLHAFRELYELRAEEELAATLRFRNPFGSLATGESGDGCWSFKRVGFLRTHVTVRDCGSDSDVAVFRNATWSGGGTLELPDGRKYPADTNFWQTRYEFKTEEGQPLVSFTVGGAFRLDGEMRIDPAAATLAELPWLAMLGWYLVVMMHHDSAAAVAATT